MNQQLELTDELIEEAHMENVARLLATRRATRATESLQRAGKAVETVTPTEEAAKSIGVPIFDWVDGVPYLRTFEE